ncbi:uncharacterized protein LOC131950584 [Physella acuta]|uniref:uncharacterized protein LOC131950584 n=1 Tax=Physella acuta TaxID=109671 RepID=UPI0027DD20A0|nr:uncharacterized protein LOC131950584 [Physella acuta]
MEVPEITRQTAFKSKPWGAASAVYNGAVYIDHLPSYEKLFQNIFLKNQLCIVGPSATSQWSSKKDWVLKDGSPNFHFLMEKFGDATAPIADCNVEEYCAHPKTEMSVKNFLLYWMKHRSQGHPGDAKCLYLKDWHFTRCFPSYNAYSPPAFLCSDWMNEFWDVRDDVSNHDDYRFVYMGPKNSWTPFHADVLHSYSWSANICGLKKWIFFPPGAEIYLKDKHRQLVFDLRSDELADVDKYPDAFRVLEGAITVFQNPGEVIFIPSGWYHQVFNLEDTISINHNWMNGCSTHLTWRFIKSRLVDVQREISDCKGVDGWDEQCQMILKADSGIDYLEFYNFLATIAEHRLAPLKQYIKDLHMSRTAGSNKAADHANSFINNHTAPYHCDIVNSQSTCPSGQCGDDPSVDCNQNNLSYDYHLAGSNHDKVLNTAQFCTSDTPASLSHLVCDANRGDTVSLLSCNTCINFPGNEDGSLCDRISENKKISPASIGARDDFGSENFVSGSNTLENKYLKSHFLDKVDESSNSGLTDLMNCMLKTKMIDTFEELCVESKKRVIAYSKSEQSMDEDAVDNFCFCLLTGKIICYNEHMQHYKKVHNSSSLNEKTEEKNLELSVFDSPDDHKGCPHWAHCGPNLALFDIRRVFELVKDMLAQAEFQTILNTPECFVKLRVHPSDLISQISVVLAQLRLVD